jgi:two-component system sensor histidine kinase UhpB
MDLRRRLLGYLGALLLVLLLVTLLISLLSLRSDVAAEIAASEHLAKVLLDASKVGADLPPAEAARRMDAILNGGPLRHLSISVGAAPVAAQSWLAAMLGIDTSGTALRLIRIGDQTLHIAPNPGSEIEERWSDTVRLCITLLIFSGTTLLVVWWSADRALTPVRDLEAGLRRLAGGDREADLPVFALREFTRVAGAIDELAAALATSRDAQRHLSRQLIRVQEDERRTLALELHDEMGQTLTAIGVTAAYLGRNAARIGEQRIVECAQDLRRDVRTSGDQLRAMLKRLRPHGMDGPGLASALRELLDGWQQREAGMLFTLAMPAQLPVLAENAGLVLYRVVQEGLTNVVKHSAARHCSVTIGVDAEVLRVQIGDDGVGLAMECGLPEAGGSGLLGMKERLLMVGGRLDLKAGTTAMPGLHLEISLPLTKQHRLETQ